MKRPMPPLEWDAHTVQLHGFALWWEAELIPGIVLTTSPHAPPTHWEQIYLPLLRDVTLEPGDDVELELTCNTRPDVGVRLVWKTIHRHGRRVIAEQRQDSLRGQL